MIAVAGTFFFPCVCWAAYFQMVLKSSFGRDNCESGAVHAPLAAARPLAQVVREFRLHSGRKPGTNSPLPSWPDSLRAVLALKGSLPRASSRRALDRSGPLLTPYPPGRKGVVRKLPNVRPQQLARAGVAVSFVTSSHSRYLGHCRG